MQSVCTMFFVARQKNEVRPSPGRRDQMDNKQRKGEGDRVEGEIKIPFVVKREAVGSAKTRRNTKH